ncbi:MAG: DUF3164 family protein [Prevotella sp.]|jgi:hypothetical protein|nr:DUF3164 family protein [Prevotella sp.]
MDNKLEFLKNLSSDERKELIEKLKNEEKEEKVSRREAYEGLRDSFVQEVKSKLMPVTEDVKGFREWLDKECEGFRAVMNEYGQLRKEGQESYTVISGDFKLEVKSNKVKSFDERADMAAERLMEYLKSWVKNSEKGADDPMYQLGMMLLERNKNGDLDYKSISKLYELEDRFDSEYADIMNLFKESNIVMATVVNYYFYLRDKDNVWRRIEPSFCRL